MEWTKFFRRNIIFYIFSIILLIYIYGCGLFPNGKVNIQRDPIPILSSASKIISFAFLNRNILYFSTDSPKFYKYIVDKNEKIQIQLPNDIKRINLIKKIEIDTFKSYIHTLVESEESGEINWEYYIYNINQSSWKKFELVGNKVFNFLLLNEKEVFFKFRDNFAIFDIEEEKIKKVITKYELNNKSGYILHTILTNPVRILLEGRGTKSSFLIYDPFSQKIQEIVLPFKMLHDFQHYRNLEFICTEGYSFSKKDKRGNILLINFQDKTKKIIALESFSKPIHNIKRVDGNLYAFSTYTGRSIPFAMGLGGGDYLIYLVSLEQIS